MEAVRSAEGLGGMWIASLKGWQWHQGEATPAESPLSSESGEAVGRWSKGSGEVEVAAEEGLGTAGCCQRTAALAAVKSDLVGVEVEVGQ